MKDTTLYAYLAGLFDGEGTVTLTKDTPVSLFRHPVLSMSSTSKNLLDLCKTTFGGSISSHKTYKDHHKPSWSWKVNGNKALFAASALLPFIQEPLKKKRLQLLIDRYKEVTPRNGKYTESMVVLKLEFEQQFFHPSDTVA